MEPYVDAAYDELKRLARVYLSRERRGNTLSPTVLVHEAYLKLVNQSVEWKDKGHFMGFAAHAMRRILVDMARSRNRHKRGGGMLQITLVPELAAELPSVDLLTVNQLLEELEKTDPDKGKLVELRFFCGLSIEETAEVMGISTATVIRSWRFTKAWLFARLQGDKKGESSAN